MSAFCQLPVLFFRATLELLFCQAVSLLPNRGP